MPARGTKRRFLGLLANPASDPGSAYIVAAMMGSAGDDQISECHDSSLNNVAPPKPPHRQTRRSIGDPNRSGRRCEPGVRLPPSRETPMVINQPDSVS
jgi:hypothetical protein